MTEPVTYEVDGDGIATITWNLTDSPMNVLNEASIAAYSDCVQKVLADDAITGVVVTSARPEFIVGADLNMLGTWGDMNAEEMFNNNMQMQHLFRSIETGGKPFVAALNGTALGGGLEVALACHCRIAGNNPKTQFGLPEVKLGLLPGGGGTQRLPRLIGIQPALELMTTGKPSNPEKAHKLGFVTELVEPGQEVATAKQWIKDNPKAKQPWDDKKFKMPGGGVQTPKGIQTFVGGNSLTQKMTFGNYPAPQAIMACVYHGAQLAIDTAIKYEGRQFVKMVRSDVAQNMIRSLFFSLNDANKLAKRPKGVEKAEFKKIGVLGAGMMGAGIAYVTAMAGIPVVLIDTDQAGADKGKAYSEDLLAARVKKGRMTQEKMDGILSLITATTNYDDMKGADLVIEAVFENREIKADVTKKSEAVMADDGIFASNTSTLPITGLAEAYSKQDNFIGLHFFSPVDKMPLVEIIMGANTSEKCLAQSLDYVKAIKKTPIVVNDSRGFYTSRVFATYVNEGIEMLAEGVTPALIDNAGKIAGMPVGPLALADEVAIDLMYKISKQTKEDLGDAFEETASYGAAQLMVEKLDRVGKKAGKGFYDYAGGKKKLWPGLGEQFPQKPEAEQPSLDEVVQRLLHVQAVETLRCMEENVVTSPEDADIGSILGWGFCPHHGGVISYVDTIGVEQFLSDCERLAQTCGSRFSPPKILRDMAAKAEGFYKKAA